MIQDSQTQPARMYKKGIKILEATVAIRSNVPSLLPQFPLKVEVKSLLTDFHEILEIPWSEDCDGAIVIENLPESVPVSEFSKRKVIFKGPFTRLTREASDLRFSFWGNQGFLYRYTLFLLEYRHRIYNFHACALVDPEKNHLYVVIGGAGSGKTVYLLSGLARGLRLFSTETVHFKFNPDGGLSWFMGSLVDNVRLGTLRHDFPQFIPQGIHAGVYESGEWQKKVALDLSAWKAGSCLLLNPGVTVILPHVEEGRQHFLLQPVPCQEVAAKALFDNISQKIAETVILYDRIPVLGLDTQPLASARLRTVNQLVGHPRVTQVVSVLSNPRDCWGGLVE